MQETASVVSAPIPCLACICPSQPQRGLKQLIGREPQSHPIHLPLTQKALPAWYFQAGSALSRAVSTERRQFPTGANTPPHQPATTPPSQSSRCAPASSTMTQSSSAPGLSPRGSQQHSRPQHPNRCLVFAAAKTRPSHSARQRRYSPYSASAGASPALASWRLRYSAR